MPRTTSAPGDTAAAQLWLRGLYDHVDRELRRREQARRGYSVHVPLDDTARALDLAPGSLRAWLGGQRSSPTLAQAAAWARQWGYPLPVFAEAAQTPVSALLDGSNTCAKCGRKGPGHLQPGLGAELAHWLCNDCF